jgi:hypothetical protein
MLVHVLADRRIGRSIRKNPGGQNKAAYREFVERRRISSSSAPGSAVYPPRRGSVEPPLSP